MLAIPAKIRNAVVVATAFHITLLFGSKAMSEQHSTAPTAEVEYRPVVGFLGYRVGDDGSIWSSWHRVGRPGGSEWVTGGRWRLLKHSIDRDGYIKYGLSREGRVVNVMAHTAVLEAFAGPCPPGLLARHYPDQSRTNNNRSNLSWATPSTNQLDKVENGTDCRGHKHHLVRLSASDIPTIRSRLAAGETSYQIAKDYGVGTATIHNIKINRAWKWV